MIKKIKLFLVVIGCTAVCLWGFILLMNILILFADLSFQANTIEFNKIQEQLSSFYNASGQCEHFGVDDVIIMVDRGEKSLAYYTWENGVDGRKKEQVFHRAICELFMQSGRQLTDYEVNDVAVYFIDPWIEFKGSVTEKTLFLVPFLIPAAIVLYRKYKK